MVLWKFRNVWMILGLLSTVLFVFSFDSCFKVFRDYVLSLFISFPFPFSLFPFLLAFSRILLLLFEFCNDDAVHV